MIWTITNGDIRIQNVTKRGTFLLERQLTYKDPKKI